jgi:hypothetical protein
MDDAINGDDLMRSLAVRLFGHQIQSVSVAHSLPPAVDFIRETA